MISFPVGFVLLLMGGTFVAMPMYAIGFLGVRFARFARAGHHRAVVGTFALLQGVALLALALHATTWDATTPRGHAFNWAVSFVGSMAGLASAGATLLVASGGPRRPELRPRLWPWVVAGLAILLLSFVGWTQAGSG